jgi:hypothetical protein
MKGRCARRGKREVEDIRVDREINQLPYRGGEIVRGAGGDILKCVRDALTCLAPRGRSEVRLVV